MPRARSGAVKNKLIHDHAIRTPTFPAGVEHDTCREQAWRSGSVCPSEEGISLVWQWSPGKRQKTGIKTPLDTSAIGFQFGSILLRLRRLIQL
jgi:hypothetical protein